MTALLRKLGLVLILTLPLSCAQAGEIIDRLVASVDAMPILQSDWDQAVAFEALQQGRTVASFTDKERREVLQRAVDQQLLRAQIGESQIAAADERDINKALEDLRKPFPLASTEDAWNALLESYGFTQDGLRQRVRAQMEVMRFIELRLRPESRVARTDVELYYNTVYTREVQTRGGKPEPLANVQRKIEEILRQQRMDALLSNWLRELRSHSEIRWIVPAAAPTPEAVTGGYL